MNPGPSYIALIVINASLFIHDNGETVNINISMKHKHHVIPRYAGGTNDPSNIVELTPEEHAEAHRKLYEAEHDLEQNTFVH